MYIFILTFNVVSIFLSIDVNNKSKCITIKNPVLARLLKNPDVSYNLAQGLETIYL